MLECGRVDDAVAHHLLQRHLHELAAPRPVSEEQTHLVRAGPWVRRKVRRGVGLGVRLGVELGVGLGVGLGVRLGVRHSLGWGAGLARAAAAAKAYQRGAAARVGRDMRE